MRQDLLEEIETEAIDGDIVKALRRCLALAGRASSVELRDWASRELQGYRGEELPDYRRVYAPLQVDGIAGNYRVTGETIAPVQLPDFVRDDLSEEVELRHSIAGLVDMVMGAKAGGAPIKLGPPEAPTLAAYMNTQSDQFHHIERIYWSISSSTIQEVIDRVRSNLVELVAEMRAGMSSGEKLPPADVAAQAVNVVIRGDKNRVKLTKSQTQQSGNATEGKGRVRRLLEVGAAIAAIASLGVVLVLNWSRIFG